METSLLYNEKVTSRRTEILFFALALLFLFLFFWRFMNTSLDFLAAVSLFLFSIFLFYSINYRTLLIRLSSEHLELSFGIFRWRIPLANVSDCQTDDELPTLMKYGGAGIHFMVIRGRYRASFNFLEHSRVVVGLRRKAGLVRDVSFSTRRPDELIPLVQKAMAASKTN